MSLLSSIFGEAQAAAASSGADLFGSKVAVPLVMHKAPSSARRRREAKASNVSAEDDDETKKNDDQSSSGSGSGGSSDEPSSPTPGVVDDDVPPSADDNDNDNDNATTTSGTKATARSKSEEEEEKRRTIFVGNLPPDIGRRSLAAIFKPCGAVASSRLRSMAVAGVKLPPEQAGNQNMMRKVCANTGKIQTDAKSKKSAQGYVVFANVESVEKALVMNNTEYESHTIRVDRAEPTVEPSRSVFVGNLPYGADEETLRDHFSNALSNGEDLNEGEGCAISGVRIIRDKETQKCKGFGYVTLRDATLVGNALRAHGTKYMKREIRVMVCGRRFKGHRGGEDAAGAGGGGGDRSGRRSFEGRRATAPGGGPSSSPTGNRSSKRKSDDIGVGGGGTPSTTNVGAAKRRRARSEKKTTPNTGARPSGVSKRAAAATKVNKRVKKLTNRVAKGMGKKKH